MKNIESATKLKVIKRTLLIALIQKKSVLSSSKSTIKVKLKKRNFGDANDNVWERKNEPFDCVLRDELATISIAMPIANCC